MPETFWKLKNDKDLYEENIGCVALEPLGILPEVTDKLLSIPTMRPQIFKSVSNKGMALLWERRNVLLEFQEEPEFGTNKVFSVKIEKIEFEKEFHKLYVQMFEVLGCVLLYKEEFIAPKRFKKLL